MNWLNDKKTKLRIEKRNKLDIVIGVPHHAPAGVARLPCNRPADENTGYLGRYIAEKLDCYSIIACNYTPDANKDLNNDYSKQLLRWKPKMLIEIHGHNRTKTQHDVEISCGSMVRNTYSIKLAEKLREKCQGDGGLRRLKICGDFNKIYFKARTAKTITYDGWMAYLIELPPELRFPDKQRVGEPPLIGYKFCDYFVECLKEIAQCCI